MDAHAHGPAEAHGHEGHVTDDGPALLKVHLGKAVLVTLAIIAAFGIVEWLRPDDENKEDDKMKDATAAPKAGTARQRYEERDLQPESVPAEEIVIKADLFTPMRARPSIITGWTPWIELAAGTRFRRYNKADGTGSVTVPYEVEVAEQYYEYGINRDDPYKGPNGERRVRYRRRDFPGNAGFELAKYELVPYNWEGDGGPPSPGKNAKGVHRVE